MGRVLSQGMSLSFAQEASLGVLPAQPAWWELEPNSITTWGTTVSKEVRTPISKSRARRKGSVVDLDSAVEFDADVTMQQMRHFALHFLFATPRGGDVYGMVAADNGSYVVSPLSAAQVSRYHYDSGGAGARTLVHVSGFGRASNNGVFPVSGAYVEGSNYIPVASATPEGVNLSTPLSMQTAGVRLKAGDLVMNAAGALLSTELDFRTLGWVVGQIIHVGGVDVLNRFANAANTGFARIVNIGQNALILEKRDAPFVAETAPGREIDILFGQFYRNVPIDDPDFARPSLQFELASPNLMPNGATGYEYAIGNWADAWSITIPLSGKATTSFGFVGTDTTKPSTLRAANAQNAKFGGLTGAFGTSSDIARLRAQDIDEAGLTTDFKSVTFTLTNNVAGEKVIGKLGPKFLNAGDIEVDVEAQLLFTNPDLIERVRCNKTVGLDWILRNGDGGIAFDLPTGTFEGGGREYPANQSVTMNATFRAHQEQRHAGLNFTLGISFFPVLPPQPCG